MTNSELLEDLQALVGRELGENVSGRSRYILEEFLDRGGFGAVFRGLDRKLDLSVAIKVSLSPSSSREFTKEAKLAAGVQHNNIVKVSDYGYDNGLAFLVMEYLHGEDLEKLFRKQGNKLTTDQLVKFVEEVGGALAYAHAEKLIHRDLKPRNIILKEHISKSGTTTANCKFVLLDFGIAAKLDTEGTQRNRTQDGAGTVEYMAPEMLGKERQATSQSDIYAFGLILYQMMTGRVPFLQSDTSLIALTECLTAISKQPPPPFREIAPDRDYLSGMEELIFRCLEKDPSRRPQTMGEVCKSFIEIYRRSLDTDEFDPIPGGEAIPENPKDLVGRVLDNRYVLEKFIDRGGYGAVYKGIDKRLEQPVAIKVGLSSREFKKEARLAAEVKHPNIVNVSDFGSDKGLAYLVMDFLYGETLERLFEKQGRKLAPDQLRKFVNEVGDALENAHDRELIHRDLKPRNIILSENIRKFGTTSSHNRFVLFDFGIAAKIDSKGTLQNITQNGAGTLEYMAPELLGREPKATQLSDIYAFGVILYQMMMGRVPFPQADTSHIALVECLQAVNTQLPPRFQDTAPDRVYPAGMEALVLQCLEKKPANRPQTMAEVRERFVKIHDHALASPIPARPKRRFVDPTGTMKPYDNLDPDEIDDPESHELLIAPMPPVQPQPKPPSRFWRHWIWPLGIVVLACAMFFLVISSPNRESDQVEAFLMDEDEKLVDEFSPLRLVAGQERKLTFAIKGSSGEVEFDAPSLDLKEHGVSIEIKDGPSGLTMKHLTIAVNDLNSPAAELPTIVFRARTKRPHHSKPFEKSLKLIIEPPEIWLPETLRNHGFHAHPDSWLCNSPSDHRVYASILSRQIGGTEVCFRLVPATIANERTISPFYVMEQLVNNSLFTEFAKSKPDEVIQREPGSRSWTTAESVDFPVTDIYQAEAQAFALWIIGGPGGTLPSTTEWEIAAGYWDFIRIATPPFDPILIEIPGLASKATIATGPSLCTFYGLRGGPLERRSPYGCQYALLCKDNQGRPGFRFYREFTRTIVDNEVQLRGSSYLEDNDITWVKPRNGVKSPAELDSVASQLQVNFTNFGRDEDVGFRVILLTNKK